MTRNEVHIGDMVRMAGAGTAWFRVEAIGPLITTIPDGSKVLTLSTPGGREFVAGFAAVSEVRRNPYDIVFDYMEQHYPGITEVLINDGEGTPDAFSVRVDYVSAEGKRQHLTLVVGDEGEVQSEVSEAA
jgi:hypothetical protein